MSVVLIPEHTRPIATISLTLRTGLLHDPPGKAGLAYVTGQMLTRGAGERSQADIADELDFLGSTLAVGVGRDTTSIEGDALLRNMDEFQALVADVLAAPTFPAEELEKVKRQTVAELVQVRDHDPSLGRRHFVGALYGDHAYGRPLKGTEESVAALTREDVVAFYEEHYRSGGALIGAAGDLERGRLDEFVAATLHRLPEEDPPGMEVGAHVDTPGYRVVLVDKPERSQTQVFLGHTTLHSTHPDFVALFLGHTIFGGTFTARLSQEIREKRGWSYGAYSYLQTDHRLGTFLMRFYPSAADTVPALEVADGLFRDLVAGGVTEAELEAAKSFLCRSHPMTLETPEKELHERLSILLHQRPEDWLETFVDEVQGTTLEAVDAALRRHLTPDALTVAIVCTASELRPALEAWGRADSLMTRAYDGPVGG